MRPVVAKLDKEIGAKVSIAIIDVIDEDGSELANDYQVSAVPTFILFDKAGKEAHRFVGIIGFEDMKRALLSL